MNERIRELSDIAYKNHLARNPHSSFGRRSDYDRELAELIVAECAVIGNKAYSDIGNYTYIGDKIREHFGVDYNPVEE
jgi:hypothetical protein